MTCRPGGDAITAAGSVACSACGQQSYPVDAEWITDRLILVSYENGHAPRCPDRGARTVLAGLDAEDDKIPAVPRPRICRGTVRGGARKGHSCCNPAAPGSAYCRAHDPGPRDMPASPAGAWCAATTIAGEPCQFRAKADGLCGVHLAQRGPRVRGGRP